MSDLDLQMIARDLKPLLVLHRREGITDANQLDVQVISVCEEAGELAGAYRRWAKKARRTGTLREVQDEIADVLIVTAVLAEFLGVDLTEAVQQKLAVIYERGWREEP